MADHRNLLALQRTTALAMMGQQAKKALDEGYPAEADRILDEMIERKRAWESEEDPDA
jgi:hypothetical protein